MNRFILAFLLTLPFIGAACGAGLFLTCEDGSTDGEEDAWADIENCNEWGSTTNPRHGSSVAYDECYPQSYGSIYMEYIEEYCGEGYI